MPTTRSGAKSTPVSINKATSTNHRHGQKPKSKKESYEKPKKRKSDANDSGFDDKENQAPISSAPAQKKPKVEKPTIKEGSNPNDAKVWQSIESSVDGRKKGPDGRPFILASDLEFDFDRSQLRDPRTTPGRKRRPRYSPFELDHEQKALKEHLEATYHIPEVEKPKGRLNAFQKNELFGKNALINPMHSFHHLHVCHEKGRDGSPTYDEAGFELDWYKVDDWMRPKPYSKSKMVNGMERALDRKQKEEDEMFKLFFKDGKYSNGAMVRDFVQDQISKDLGIPWHQIGPKLVKTWRDKGFEPVDYLTWWEEPNKVERDRMMKMHSGCVNRKDL